MCTLSSTNIGKNLQKHTRLTYVICEAPLTYLEADGKRKFKNKRIRDT